MNDFGIGDIFLKRCFHSVFFFFFFQSHDSEFRRQIEHEKYSMKIMNSISDRFDLKSDWKKKSLIKLLEEKITFQRNAYLSS